MAQTNGNAPLPVESQISHIVSWFTEFTANERHNFMVVMFQCFGSELAQNGTPTTRTSSGLLYPTIFHCRMELFRDWASQWTSYERTRFFNNLRAIDDGFVTAYEAGDLPIDPTNPTEPDLSFLK